MSDVERKRKTIINIIYYALVLALIYIVLRYAFSTLFPIVLAFLTAAVLQKPKKKLLKIPHMKKGLASVICVFSGLFIIALLISLIGVRLSKEVSGFVDYIIIQLQNIDVFINNIENALSDLISYLPSFLSESLRESLTLAFVQLRQWLSGADSELPGQITESISGAFDMSWITTPLSGVISTASKIPSAIIAVVITIVAACFMTTDFEKITAFVQRQLPDGKYRTFLRTKTLMKDTLWKMAKAYTCIICVTFAEMMLGLGALNVLGIYSSKYIALIALVTAIIDIIPVLGTGTILLPWAAYSLIVANFPMAIGLLVIYAVITVIRQIIEPKFVAGQLGLPPFLTISAMYIGLKFFGVFGMLAAPIVLTLIRILNREGIIHLWKSSAEADTKAESSEKTEENKTEENTQTEKAEEDKKEA